MRNLLTTLCLIAIQTVACSEKVPHNAINENNDYQTYQMNLLINGHTLTATMAANSSAAALKTLLENGDITVEAHDYGSFEKVGALPQSLPTNNESITTEAGDLILYQGQYFVLYYAPNTYHFTRLGKINNITQSELKTILGTGNVTIVLSLDSTTGLSEIQTNDEIKSIEIFTLNGTLLGKSLDALQDGVNIVRYKTTKGEIITKKIIK